MRDHPTDPPEAARPAMPLRARAFAGLDRNALKLAVALALILAFIDRANYVLVQIQHGHAVRYLLFTLLDLAFQLGIVGTMLALVVAAINLGPRPPTLHYAVLAVAIVAASAICAALRMEYLYINSAPGRMTWDLFPRQYLLPFMQRYAVLSVMLAVVVEFHRRETRSIEAMHQAELDRITLEREMAEARLQVLQAQIEPHFLFNTLANVRRLYRTDVAAGHRMLDHLMRYFEVALPRMRDHVSTLAREATLIEAYLSIQQIRMGRRLTFSIDLPESLNALIVPSMMLLTLVENSIKHGLNPLLEGGDVTVSARRDGDVLRVSVADDGAGFGTGTSGGGTGLANIRARLSATYGSAADLALSALEPRGVCATLVVPIEQAAPSAAVA